MGEVPTYSWVVQCMKAVLSTDVAGHSLQSGGAMALALSSTPDDHIQAQGWWYSDSYHVYICRHPVMLQSLLHGCSAFNFNC